MAVDLTTTSGRYQLLELLARGGMGEVHVALRRFAGGGAADLVAIKLLTHGAQAAEASVEMFLTEARVVARLCHRHVVEVIDVDVCGDQHFMVMEYICGENLREMLRDRALPGRGFFGPRLTALLFHDLADALACVHGAGLIHRDITPSNVMIRDDGIVKLIDFGVSRLASAAPATTPGRLKGKIGYMAPEYLRGEPYDHRVDIFALGVVMWEAFARRRLFRATSPGDQLRRVLEDEIPRVDQVDPTIPRVLGTIVARALARDPARRYPSADVLGCDLADALRRIGLDEEPTLERWLRRHHAGPIADRARDVARRWARCGELLAVPSAEVMAELLGDLSEPTLVDELPRGRD